MMIPEKNFRRCNETGKSPPSKQNEKKNFCNPLFQLLIALGSQWGGGGLEGEKTKAEVSKDHQWSLKQINL